MACYIERPLNDIKSNEFLRSAGFTLQPSCSVSQWSGNDLVFYLKEDEIIRSWGQLIRYLLREEYNKAYDYGKASALETIYEHLNSLVFPPPQVNYNKLTVE